MSIGAMKDSKTKAEESTFISSREFHPFFFPTFPTFVKGTATLLPRTDHNSMSKI
jgi:hypothetical protein